MLLMPWYNLATLRSGQWEPQARQRGVHASSSLVFELFAGNCRPLAQALGLQPPPQPPARDNCLSLPPIAAAH
jgi:hypothetical protein